MTTHFDFNELFDSAKESPAYKLELAVLDITEEIVARMECMGVTRADLARRLKCEPAYVTKILRGSTNFTLETLVKIADVLGCRMRTHLQPEGTRTHWFDVQDNVQRRTPAFQTRADMTKIFHEYARCTGKKVKQEVKNDPLSFAS